MSTSEREFLSVASGSNYLQKQENQFRHRKNRLAWPVALLWGAAVVVVALHLLVRLCLGTVWPPGWVVLLVLALVAGSTRLLRPIDRHERAERSYHKGRQGEEVLAAFLADHLDASWTLYRNVVLPDGRGDIDAVLVGPRGIYALEVKAYSGSYRNEGKTWRRRQGGRWVEMKNSPTRQALGNAVRLHHFLKERDVVMHVEPRVVWVGPGRVRFRRPAAAIWVLSSPAYVVRKIRSGKESSQKETAAVRMALTNIASSA
jgi:hypothetical protein